MRNPALGTMAILATMGCAKAEQGTPSPPATATARPSVTPAPSAAPVSTPAPIASAAHSRETEEACVDRWLATRRLDPYGSPAGTMYTGGTPLFDERTGERRDRLEYVYKRQPAASDVCRRPPAVR